MTNPTEHAKAAMQMAFELFREYEIMRYGRTPNVSEIDLQFWGRTYSHVSDAQTVRITSLLRKHFEQPELVGMESAPARYTIVHEAWHVVQAQGRSRLGWWWHYLLNRYRLEREADAMAVKYRDQIR